jgi:cystinosin
MNPDGVCNGTKARVDRDAIDRKTGVDHEAVVGNGGEGALHNRTRSPAVVAGVVLAGLSLVLGLVLPLSPTQGAMQGASLWGLHAPWGRISAVVGWLYFCAWSASFYPQIFLNRRTQSVRGLSTDFQALNLIGFGCYAAYTLALFYSDDVRIAYERANNGQAPPVESNDVFFCIHAFLTTALTLAQISWYGERGVWGSMALWCRVAVGALGLAALAYFCACLFFAQTVAAGSNGPLSWLAFVGALSEVKLAISICKYLPQLWMNFARRSTVGWSIGNVLLDFTGGTLSEAQLLLDCGVTGKWSDAFGNPVKLGLGLLSIVFDIAFMLQHYVCFPSGRETECPTRHDGELGDVIDLEAQRPLQAPLEAPLLQSASIE